MAKEVKPRERAYLKRAKVEFNGKWTVDGNSVDSVINKAIAFFDDNRVIKDKSAYKYFNVSYSISRLHAAESFWNQDIIQSWLDMFHEYVACAVYNDAYIGTVGGEKDKGRAADTILAAYHKAFA